jgi:hypothetical protein
MPLLVQAYALVSTTQTQSVWCGVGWWNIQLGWEVCLCTGIGAISSIEKLGSCELLWWPLDILYDDNDKTWNHSN